MSIWAEDADYLLPCGQAHDIGEVKQLVQKVWREVPRLRSFSMNKLVCSLRTSVRMASQVMPMSTDHALTSYSHAATEVPDIALLLAVLGRKAESPGIE